MLLKQHKDKSCQDETIITISFFCFNMIVRFNRSLADFPVLKSTSQQNQSHHHWDLAKIADPCLGKVGKSLKGWCQ